MKNKFLLLLTMMIICISTCVFAAIRDVSYEESLATDLKALGLFKGVSDTEFDLQREPTRVEALVMLIRTLGKEQEALNGNWSHPFTDVPSWADKYVGYAYENNLTNGVSKNEFGTSNASGSMYLTFVLRALGYSDTNGQDFSWNDPYTLAQKVGILSDHVDTDNFMRADAVLVSYNSLQSNIKDSETTLATKLMDSNVFTQEQFEANYKFKEGLIENNNAVPVVDETYMPETTKDEDTYSLMYILNTNTKKFHYPSCGSVKQMKDKNKQEFSGSRSDIISLGYEPCKNCNP